MSKQNAKPIISHRLRRGLAGILSLVLLFGLLPATAVPAAAAEHWATPYVNTLVDWGVMRGDINGNMAPERSITRAEFVTMMNRAYGYTKTAGHPFTDVTVRDWYNDDIDIAYNMGYFKGTAPTQASPNSPLTREQAAVLLARNMMLQPTVGETLGFSDTRSLDDWSRGLVGAAAENGILGGYSDGSFRPKNNITRGEVAAMLVRAIGTPVQEPGDHNLGNVYGNVTVNTSGVRLRDGVITGNLYLTGGIDLGDVLLENITVLGEIIVSGGGESSSGQSSIVMRNVTAKNLLVDSIGDQFVTIRAEGNTSIQTTTVRTNAYIDDSALPGYGLWKIIQDGGSLLQLAGNPKEVINKTPNSELQIVQGVADKVTIDEKATNSSVLVDGDARVGELNLDVATNVTGEGDIGDLNVGAAGSTVEQLPDSVTIRPGITSDVHGSTMNSTQAAESSADPRLLAGYPKAKNIAPTSATLVFSVNKPGTIYWAVSAVADGSVSEEDLIENPAYGGKIIKSGTIKADKANTEYTVNLTGLTQGGSYYISAILVDGRDKRSPVKVTAFTTPDGTTPAFVSAPVVTMATTKTAQVTGMPNKSCLLYWALLPEGAAAPTPAEFKANAITGNLGYGSMDVIKNVSQSINVNRGILKEKTRYVAYLWLTDYDGAKSSQVYKVIIYIPDETPPIVYDVRQTNSNENSVEVSFTMNETGKLYWAIVTDEMHEKGAFIPNNGLMNETEQPGPATTSTNAYMKYDDADTELAAKIAVLAGTGAGAIVSGSTNVTAANTLTKILMAATRGLDPATYNTSIFYLYYVGEDSEKPNGNLSEHIGVKEVNVKDAIKPYLAEQRFDTYNPSDLEHPLATTNIDLIFSEGIRNGPGTSREDRFWELYKKVEDLLLGGVPESNPDLIAARDNLGEALHECIKLYVGDDIREVEPCVWSSDQTYNPETCVLNYRYAKISRESGTGRMIVTFPHNATNATGQTIYADGEPVHAVNLKSGATYHFEIYNVYDCAAPSPNPMEPNSSCMKDHKVTEFRVAFAQVQLKNNGLLPGIIYNARKGESTYFTVDDSDNSKRYGELQNYDSSLANWENNPPQRMDAWFTVTPVDLKAMQDDPDSRYDILFWADRDVEVTIYSRETPKAKEGDPPLSETDREKAPWTYEGTAKFAGTANQTAEQGGNGFIYQSLMKDVRKQTRYDLLSSMSADREYAIHIDMLHFQGTDNTNSGTWYDTVHFRISVVAGNSGALSVLNTGTRGNAKYNSTLRDEDLSSLGVPEYVQSTQTFSPNVAPTVYDASIDNSDTNPTIWITLDNPGYCNYLLFELKNLQYWSKDLNDYARVPSNQRITEQMLINSTNQYFIQKYTVEGGNVYKTEAGKDNPPLKDVPNLDKTDKPEGYLDYFVEVPSPSTVIGSSFPDTVQRGVTASGSGTSSRLSIIPRRPLKANTVYLLCVAPQGESGTPESLAKKTYCFRFTTESAQAPVLTLRERGSINVNATVDRTAQVEVRLLRQNSLTNTIFYQTLGEAGIDSSIDGYRTYEGWTVMKALTDVRNGRTVFDQYASDDLKERMKDIVMRGAQTSENVPSTAFYDNWGPQEIPVAAGARDGTRPTTFDENRADPNTPYFCIGIAYINEEGPWSFAALPGLRVVTDTPPRITSIGNGLTYTRDPENPLDSGKINGTLTITFDQYLYLTSPNGDGVLPMAHISNVGSNTAGTIPGTVKGGDGTDFVPIGLRITAQQGVSLIEDNPPFLRRTSISFNVTEKAGDTISITIPDLYNQWEDGYASVNVTLRWVNNNWSVTVRPDDALAPGYRP